MTVTYTLQELSIPPRKAHYLLSLKIALVTAVLLVHRFDLNDSHIYRCCVASRYSCMFK
jgi:hypothetical protein